MRVKKFGKSANIWRRYGQKFAAYFFGPPCKLGDFLVENRACFNWTIKSDDFSGRQIRPIFAWQTTDFCCPILLADEIGQLYRSSDNESPDFIEFSVVFSW